MTCPANSHNFPPGLSVYFLNFQVSSEPLHVEYPDLNFPKYAAFLATLAKICALHRFDFHFGHHSQENHAMKCVCGLNLVRLGNSKYMESELIGSRSNLFAVLEKLCPSFRDLDFWRTHRMFTQT